jgi:hypothetical protein
MTNCVVCNKEFVYNDRRRKGLYCSFDCYSVYRKNKIPLLNCKCKQCQKEFHRKPSAIKNGEGSFCSRVCKNEYQKVDPEESYNQRHLLRQSTEYKVWRRASLKLHDNKCENCRVENRSVCKCCGNQVFLHIHHIKPFSSFKEGRFDPTNSSVLCSKCHKDTENNSG